MVILDRPANLHRWWHVANEGRFPMRLSRYGRGKFVLYDGRGPVHVVLPGNPSEEQCAAWLLLLFPRDGANA